LTIRIAFDVESDVLEQLNLDPATFARELRTAAAVAWYERQQVSQGLAAEIAGLSRAELIDALGRYEVSPFQDTPEELLEASQVMVKDGLVTAPSHKKSATAPLVRLPGPSISETVLEDREDRF
jgi:predicted HTH domain antitoxin